MSTCLVFLLLTGPWIVQGAKILLLPMPTWGSHINKFSIVSKELVKRGHTTHMVLSHIAANTESFEAWSSTASRVFTYKPKEGAVEFEGSYNNMVKMIVKTAFDEDKTEYNKWMSESGRLFQEDVGVMLNDASLNNQIKQGNYDLAIVDGFFFIKAMFIIPYKYDIPYMAFTTQVEPTLIKAPWLPSFVPHQHVAFSESMTFTERLTNTILNIRKAYDLNPGHLDDLVRKHAPNKPFKTLPDIVRNSKFWLIKQDIVLDYPKPQMPHMASFGGYTMKTANPLTGKLRDFASNAKNGLIVVSFGSAFPLIPDDSAEIFERVLSQLPYKVVWRYTGTFKITAPNILIADWLPQNDLLGHEYTRLFITHCGDNGQMESLYHGVPMLGFPIMTDQFYNARRMEYKGYGHQLKFTGLTQQIFQQKINEILNSEIIKANVKRASSMLRNRKQTAAERAGDIVDHILEHGGDYLRPVVIDMPWYQILMLDIFAFVLMTSLFIVVILALMLRILFKVFWKHGNKEKIN